jgi:hypothetical protein
MAALALTTTTQVPPRDFNEGGDRADRRQGKAAEVVRTKKG